MPNTETNNTEGTEVQESQTEGNANSSIDVGDPVTFEDIINHPDYKDDYQKAVDRAVSKAINSFKKNHDSDTEKTIADKVNEAVNAVKFDATLKENLMKAGVIDNVALMAHLDLKDLRTKYDPNTGVIKDLDKTIESAKEKMPYLFKNEGTQSNGQQMNGGFKKNVEINSLAGALKAKYKN